MSESLKKRTIRAVAWNAAQRYGSLVIAFFTNMLLARMLTPDDFGVIGLLTVFITVATSIMESGFNSALIQRKDVSQKDYCTVFYWNLTMSILLVIVLYMISPSLAKYFRCPILCDTLRTESIILIINSFCIVQQTRLMKFLRFKILAIRTVVATIISSIVGVLLAWMGCGVWSLVWQSIIYALIGALLLWGVADWKPSLAYSWASFKKMFKFGVYVFISSICNTLYINIQSFIIGKAFSIRNLGFYTQAKKLETIPVDGTASVLNTVLFPVYATVADDRIRHRNIVRKNIKLVTFLTFPLMVLLIIIAHPLIILLFTSKWELSVPIFQILCISGMFTPLNMANTEIFRSIGAGGVYLTLQTLKRIVGLGILACFIPLGLYPLLWAIAAVSIVSYFLNLIFTHKYFGYTYRQQLSDIIPNLALTAVVGFTVKCLTMLANIGNVANILLTSVIFCTIYLGIAFLFKMKSIVLIKEIIGR